MTIKKTKRKNKKPLVFAAIVIIVAAGIGTYVWHHDKRTPGLGDTNAKTTSNLATAQPNYNSGTPRPTSSSGASQGGAKDNNGVIPTNTTISTTGSGQPTSSTSGLITVDNPTNGQTISSGAEIYGEAQVSTVQFQLIDNQSGQIASGSLNVVNGKYSGTLQFKSYSSSGKLNIFSQASPSSPETNLISFPVGLE